MAREVTIGSAVVKIRNPFLVFVWALVTFGSYYVVWYYKVNVELRDASGIVVIAVSDWDRSNSFYRDIVGAELVELDRGRYAYRLDGGQQLNVHGPGATPHPRAADPVHPGSSDLCFVWDGSVDEAIEHLRAH